MKSFSIEFVNGHPIIENGNDRILIDTGSPSTIHVAEKLEFAEREYDVSTSLMGVTPQSISESIGTKITTLLGADVLRDFGLLFDYQSHLLEFSNEYVRQDGNEIVLRDCLGIPIADFVINGQSVSCALDTGARLSYLPQEFTVRYPPIGTEEDFFPFIGEFETDCFEIEAQIDGVPFTGKYGNLPALLQMSLMLAGAQGVMGYDFFKAFKISLGLRDNRLSFK